MCAVLLAFPSFSQVPPPRMVTVTGEASEQVAPDQAVLAASLISKDLELANAKRDNDQMVEKLVSIAREFKIAKDKIATSNVYISPEYSYQPNKRTFIGYTVNRTINITMDDISIHERVLSAIVDAKIDQVNGVQFTLAHPEKLSAAVRVKAVEDAKEKAQALATAAGAKLGPVISISANGASVMPMPYPMAKMAMRAGDMSESSVAPSLPGMVTLSESVTLSFALE